MRPAPTVVEGVRVLRLPDAAAVAAAAAAALIDAIYQAQAQGRDPVIGVATGDTPQATYARVTAAVESGCLDPARAWIVALDEYVGLGRDDPRRYRHELLRKVVEPWGVDPTRLLVPEVDSADLTEAAHVFEERLAAIGGVDLQLLGIGRNGHVGFNEPGSDPEQGTRLVRLAPSTRAANAVHFRSVDEVPQEAVSQGLATILRARRLLLLATGPQKAAAVAAALGPEADGPVPASVIRSHPHVTVVLDHDAARLLR